MSATRLGHLTAPRSTKCPLCAADDSADIGEILHPEQTMIAGVSIDLSETEFRLFRCRSCGFSYKSPRMLEERLLEWYTNAGADTWRVDGDSRGRRFDQIAALVATYSPGRRVLDIGCFTGDLLSFMGSGWERFGIEPNLRAAAQAADNGITILGPTLADVPSELASFDAILAIDVVEHLVDPFVFFRDVSAILRAGGIFIVFTGNTDARSWRLLEHRYWYCNIPEHVSFYCKQCFDYIALSCGFMEIEHMTLSHNRWGMKDRAIQAAKNLGYAAMSRADGLRIPALRRRFVERRAPVWITANDHILYVMKKSEVQAS